MVIDPHLNLQSNFLLHNGRVFPKLEMVGFLENIAMELPVMLHEMFKDVNGIDAKLKNIQEDLAQNKVHNTWHSRLQVLDSLASFNFDVSEFPRNLNMTMEHLFHHDFHCGFHNN